MSVFPLWVMGDLGVGLPSEELSAARNQEDNVGGTIPSQRGSNKHTNRRNQRNNYKQAHSEGDSVHTEESSYKSALLNKPSSHVINSSSGNVGGDPSREANLPWYGGVCLRWKGSFGFAKGILTSRN
jgi:hypothetical protein